MAEEPDQKPLSSEEEHEDNSNVLATASTPRKGSAEATPPVNGPSPSPKDADVPSNSPILKETPNGVVTQDDSEAETEILSGSQQNTPAKGKQAGDEVNGQPSKQPDQTERLRQRKDGRKRKKSNRDNENESDSSWTSDGSTTFKKPRLSSPKAEIKSEDDSTPASARPSGNEHMVRLRKRKAQNEVSDLSGNYGQNKDSNPPSLSPRSRPQRGTTQEPSARTQSPQRRPHRRAASIHTALPTIETRRSKRHAHNPRDASTPSSPEESPAQITPLPTGMVPPRRGRDHFGDTALARLCAKGDLNGVKKALEQNPHYLDEANNAGNTPLHHASLKGHDAVVEFLLQRGCKTAVVNESGESPLHDAVGNSHVACVRLLLAAGLDPREANSVGETPKDLVCDTEDGQKIETLLTDAIKNAPERAGSVSTPQLPSQSSGYLRATPGGTNLRLVNYSVKALQDYAAHGNEDGVNEMLRAEIVPDQNCVVAAAAAGHDGILSILLSMVADTDPDPKAHKDNTPLLKAIGKGHLRVINVLLNHVDPKRKTYHGKTYPEVARDARGPNWQDEVNMLERALEGKDPIFPIPSLPTIPEAKMESAIPDNSASSSPEPVKRRRRLVQSKQMRSLSSSGPSGSPNDGPRLAAPVANMMRTKTGGLDSSSSPQREVSRKNSETHKLPNGDATDKKSQNEVSKDESETAVKEEDKATEEVTEKTRKQIESEKGQAEAEAALKKAEAEKFMEEKTQRIREEIQKKEAARKEAEAERLRKEEAERAEKEEARRKQEIERAKAEAARKKEELERQRREEEARKQAELERQRQEEARRREEAERAQKEEARRKAEEAQRIARELEEREAYLDKMPKGVRRPLSLGTMYPVSRANIKPSEVCLEDWMPVQVVQRYEIDPECPPSLADEWMMLNLHAAILLGERTLDLKSHPNWQRFECTAEHKKEMLSQYRHFLHADCKLHLLTYEERQKSGLTNDNYAKWINQEEEKWRAWPPSWLFWIKFDDFIAHTTPDKAPRLRDVKIVQAAQCHPKRISLQDPSMTDSRLLWEPVVRQAEEKMKNGTAVNSSDLDFFFRTSKARMPKRMVYVNGRPTDQSPAPM